MYFVKLKKIACLVWNALCWYMLWDMLLLLCFLVLFLGKVFFEISFSRELIILFRSFLEDLWRKIYVSELFERVAQWGKSRKYWQQPCRSGFRPYFKAILQSPVSAFILVFLFYIGIFSFSKNRFPRLK